MNKEIVFYNYFDSYPVINFIQELTAEIKADVIRYFDLLEEFGTGLGSPFVRVVYRKQAVWELKVPHGNDNIFFYFHDDHKSYIMLHGIVSSRETDYKTELSLACRRLEEVH